MAISRMVQASQSRRDSKLTLLTNIYFSGSKRQKTTDVRVAPMAFERPCQRLRANDLALTLELADMIFTKIMIRCAR
jgi:hypothetical protein